MRMLQWMYDKTQRDKIIKENIRECRGGVYSGQDGIKQIQVVWACREKTDRFCSKHGRPDGEKVNNYRKGEDLEKLSEKLLRKILRLMIWIETWSLIEYYDES